MILNILKELQELHNDYLLAPDKIEIKREILCDYQLKIADFITSLLAMLKNYCLTFLIKENL